MPPVSIDLTPFRHLYPFTSRWLDLDGLQYHYVDEGAGEPIVCVHGNPSWSFLFRDVIAGMRDTHRVLAVDHIGCGLSDKPNDATYPYRLERRIADLERFLDAKELTEGVTLVLHDWGGMIGMGAALRRPQRIARIVLLNTAAFLLPPGKKLPARLWVIRNLGPLAALMVRGFNAFSYGATKMATVSPLATDVSRAFRAPYHNWDTRRATHRFVEDIPLAPVHPSHAAAKAVDDGIAVLNTVPKLICWGEQDFVFDAAFLAEWRRRFPDAEVHTFPDAGHYVLEDAGDKILPLIRDFLRRQPSRQAGAQTEART